MKIGDKAINFTLKDKDNNDISLSDFSGKKIILYFYPKDNTPGWIKQARNFGENYSTIQSKNAVVIGISKDGSVSHARFIEKNNLPFILLSDTTGKVMEDYGVWKEKKVFGKTALGINRTTFLIDEEGTIVDIIDGKRMKAATNADDILSGDFLK